MNKLAMNKNEEILNGKLLRCENDSQGCFLCNEAYHDYTKTPSLTFSRRLYISTFIKFNYLEISCI